MMSFVVWWSVGFFGSVLGLTYVEAQDAIGWLNVAAGFIWWLLMCQVWVWRPCTGACRVNGSNGKLYDWSGGRKYWRDCPDCGGRGKQFRLFVLPNHPVKVAARN